ncbi:Hypothetical protein ORPV_73 [Orpheovirus IHUMI-LCC2]|uniref:F-box domain-containing protein n=1 Tax=Orpheovirus IHUMI-LCC2 TaxID=2023057 RepID=A0A2I2L385_9VIRU|nr:Hypothetical protein ORPV_73 [Orpheovirus IHUMI-LCC2]SNW61977.1 Hypothetical protein ORPV_73 [Orpheovirus IHUMI-LCC2]
MEVLNYDMLRSIFDRLYIIDIINYCTTNNWYSQLIQSDAFRLYFINKFFMGKNYNNDYINNLWIVPIDDLLLIAYVENVHFTEILKSNPIKKVKRMILEKYLGCVPGLEELNGNQILQLLQISYPLIPSDSENINKELLHIAFMIGYNANSIGDMYDSYKDKQDIDVYIDRLCIYYDRKDVWKMLMGEDPSPEYVNDYHMENNKPVASNYLTYTHDQIHNINIEPSLLVYSDHPLVLFNKYKDRFLNNDDFRNGYNGNVTNNINNNLGYMMRDDVDMNIVNNFKHSTSLFFSIGRVEMMKMRIAYFPYCFDVLHPCYIRKALDVLSCDRVQYEKVCNMLTIKNIHYCNTSHSNYYKLLTIMLDKFSRGWGTSNDINKIQNILCRVKMSDS